LREVVADIPQAGGRFAQLLLRVHGKKHAVEVANQVATSRGDAGDHHSAKVWKGIAADVKRGSAGNRR
jgi:hypothetical protein